MITKHGIVTAAKMTRTVTVTVHRSVVHPMYQKRYRVSTKFLADTGDMTVHVGDEVVITECRPLSKRKHFRITEITKKAPQVSEVAEEKGLAEAMGTNVAKGTKGTGVENDSPSQS
ncbi:30S ribosomal protein S17 [Candidatus Peregrinibacteria bacterium]|nr:30S ribosomal protein S17 [Candidatus Peregrinibacteria bacterium]